ncbi:MAG: hypothetical protein V8R40_02630 [Dysosmobacter sp.]
MRGNLCRPFLGITREDAGGLRRRTRSPMWRTRPTDPDAAARNLLRHQVMPLLRQDESPGGGEHGRTAACGRGERGLEELTARSGASGRSAAGAGFPCG